MRNNVVFESTANLNRIISLTYTLNYMPSTRFNQRSKQITKTIMILGISTSQKLLFDNVMVYNFYLVFQYWRCDNANDLRQQRKNKHSYCINFVHINNVYVWELYGVKIHLLQPFDYQYLVTHHDWVLLSSSNKKITNVEFILKKVFIAIRSE